MRAMSGDDDAPLIAPAFAALFDACTVADRNSSGPNGAAKAPAAYARCFAKLAATVPLNQRA